MMLHKGNALYNVSSWSDDRENVYHVRLNHQKRPYNILDAQTMSELDYILENFIINTKYSYGYPETKGYRGVIFSSGKSTFISGADVKEIAGAYEAPEELIDYTLKRGQSLFNRIEDLKIPTVAIINGLTMGGGLELALACTSRILVGQEAFVGEEYSPIPKPKLALPEVKLGVVPSWGGTTRLPRIISPIKAMDIICSGRNVYPEEALKIGLVDKIISRRLAYEEAYNIIDSIDHEMVRESKFLPAEISKWKMCAVGKVMKFLVGRKQKKMFGSRDKYPSPYRAIELLKKSLSLTRGGSLDLEREAFIELVKTEESREVVGRFLSGER